MAIKRLLGAFIVAVSVLLLASAAIAQQDPTSKQERAQLKFKELHASMQRLQVALAKTGPEDSEVLSLGNKLIQERQIHENMAGVRKLLEESQWDAALAGMDGLRKDLEQLMNLLLNRDMDLKKLLEEIEKLEAFLKRVEGLLGDQHEEKENAARTEALQQQLEAIEKAKSELEDLIGNQQQLRQASNDAGMATNPEAAKEMAQRQGELKTDAEKLAERIKDIEAAAAELKKADDAAAAEAKPGDAKKPGEAKPSEAKPGEAKPKDGKGEPGAGKAGACSGSCQGAGQSMGKSQDKLGQNKPESSLKDQDHALDQLRAAKKELEAMAEEAQRELLQLPFEQQARAQDETKMDTDTLSKDMEKAGEAKEGEESKPVPGTPNVQQAVPKQKAAAGMLKEHRPSQAKQKQQDAQQDLEDAKKKLEDALAQLRQQLQDEVLRSLEERFAAMLAKQKEISARTVRAENQRAEALTADGELPTALKKQCSELGEGEFDLASDAGDALKLLEQEGTTAVFPELVEELKGDLTKVGERLVTLKTGEATQQMQAEIVEALKTLINALRRAIEEGEGQCGSCDGQPPLVPMSAELKLVQALQKRVHKRTVEYDGLVPQPQRVTQENQDAAGEISRKQGRVEELTRKLAVKLNKQEAEANPR